MMNRRGRPVRIRSDRGTNFVGALSEGTDLFNTCANAGIEWVFNAPGNPEAGGCWERLVQAVKRVLAVTLKEVAPKIDVFTCFLIEAENIVNSRPLTDLPLGCADDEPLTPNHFLIGEATWVQTPFAGKVNLQRQWRQQQLLCQTYWKRWLVEYLPELTKRSKWHKKGRNLVVGDVVVVFDKDFGACGRRGESKRCLLERTGKCAQLW